MSAVAATAAAPLLSSDTLIAGFRRTAVELPDYLRRRWELTTEIALVNLDKGILRRTISGERMFVYYRLSDELIEALRQMQRTGEQPPAEFYQKIVAYVRSLPTVIQKWGHSDKFWIDLLTADFQFVRRLKHECGVVDVITDQEIGPTARKYDVFFNMTGVDQHDDDFKRFTEAILKQIDILDGLLCAFNIMPTANGKGLRWSVSEWTLSNHPLVGEDDLFTFVRLKATDAEMADKLVECVQSLLNKTRLRLSIPVHQIPKESEE